MCRSFDYNYSFISYHFHMSDISVWGNRQLANRQQTYNYAKFTVADSTAGYDVKATATGSFGKQARVGYVRITTNQTIEVAFNSSSNYGIEVTSSESPFEVRDLDISNIYISNNSGNVATVKVFSCY